MSEARNVNDASEAAPTTADGREFLKDFEQYIASQPAREIPPVREQLAEHYRRLGLID